jgi:two-component system, chemotaxis family, sensor kinase CheA
MSDRREALRGRFRARALDRIRQLTLALIEVEEGRGTAEIIQTVARELHTLKGDSRMLGFAKVAELTHAIEGMLAGAKASGALPPGPTCQVIGKELDVIARYLRGDLGEESAGEQALAEATARVSAGGASTAPAVAQPSPRSEEATAIDGPAAEPAPQEIKQAPPPSPVATSSPTPAKKASAENRWVQVNASRLDDLCERVFEFAADFRALSTQVVALSHHANGATGSFRSVIEDLERRGSQVEDLTGAAWALRLSPVEPMLQELIAHGREIAAAQGKKVHIQVRAAGAEVERRILDELWEPLLHLVRNAVDHGIEPPSERKQKNPEAMVTITAEPVGPSVMLTVADDGRGIDVALVRAAAIARGLVTREAAETLTEADVFEFLFVHGFSTRTEVSEVSGRGVGLDVVQRKIESLGGTVSISSEVGRGTRFSLTVPAAISRERSLVVECGGVLFALPSRNVAELVRLSDVRTEPVAGGMMVRYRDEAVPFRSISAALQTISTEEPWLVLLESGSRRYAFGVPGVVGERELVRRPVDSLVARTGFVAASATLDDGRLVLILAVAGLIRRSEGRLAPRPTPTKTERPTRRSILVVDDSPMARDLVVEILSGLHLTVRTAGDGEAALASMDEARPDLVLSDVEMPRMDGFELLRRLRAKWQHLPVVMLTTRGSPEDRRQAASLGANAYLIKSEFEEATLVDTVQRLLGGGR